MGWGKKVRYNFFLNTDLLASIVILTSVFALKTVEKVTSLPYK